MNYYAQIEKHFINYLFKKDMSYTRLKDTERLIDTIIYSEEQINLLRKIHPDIVALSYGRATVETRALHRKKFTEVSNDRKHLIVKYLNL